MEVQEKIWWIEHQIRSLTKIRGMRVGKAIRRLFGTDDDTTGALSRLWDGEQFAVVVSDSAEVWAGAYEQIRSCMQSAGLLCHRAYGRHGVQIVAAIRGGRYTARALMVGGRFPKAYGDDSFALECLLALAGAEKSDEWFVGQFDPKDLAVAEGRGHWVREEDGYFDEWGALPSYAYKERVAQNPERFRVIEETSWGALRVVEWRRPERRFVRRYVPPAVIFRPYLDGYGR